jgi:hypothetical protein
MLEQMRETGRAVEVGGGQESLGCARTVPLNGSGTVVTEVVVVKDIVQVNIFVGSHNSNDIFGSSIIF